MDRAALYRTVLNITLLYLTYWTELYRVNSTGQKGTRQKGTEHRVLDRT